MFYLTRAAFAAFALTAAYSLGAVIWFYPGTLFFTGFLLGVPVVVHRIGKTLFGS